MDGFAMFGKVTAKPGQRDALVEHLLEAARLLAPLPGCEFYIINTVTSEPDVVAVFELWHTQADHDASLTLDSIKALITRAQPLIAGFEGTRLVPVGGKGLKPSTGPP